MMPQPGPEGDYAYLPHEAYDLIGRQKWAALWIPRFSGQRSLPHLPLAKKIVKRGGSDAEALGALLALGDSKYDEIQTQRRREAAAVSELLDALEWGKAQAWRRLDGTEWQPIPPHHWRDKDDLKRALVDDIAAYWRDASFAPGDLLIDKRDLDKWLPNVTAPAERSPVVALTPGRAGRPRLKHVEALIAELHARHKAGKLPPIKDKRTQVCAQLQAWYAGQFPDDTELVAGPRGKPIVKSPNVKTILKKLSKVLDKLE
jgi:hypothetical protein